MHKKRIAITTIGTLGDVQPYVALAVALKKHGYSVVLAAPSDFEPLAKQYDIEFHSLGTNIRKYLSQSRFDLLISKSALFHVPNLVWQAGKIVLEAGRQFWKAAQGADLIIMQINATYGIDVAEALQIPVLMKAPNPLHMTGTQPFCALDKLGNLGPFLNRATYLVLYLQQFLHNPFRNITRRKVLGLKPLKVGTFLKKNSGKPLPVFYSYSDKISPRPIDWPKTAMITGYMNLKSNVKWQPPQSFKDFIAAGEKPIYIGFGSMPFGAVRNTQILKEALKQWGGRAIVSRGWGGIKTEDLPDTVYAVEQVPHDQLFKYVSAVVHHGGAGTTSTGLHCGLPTLVIPQTVDQPFWGRRVHELGCGPKPIPLRKLTVENLVHALTELTGNPQYRLHAQEMAKTLNAEDGTGVAIKVIEKILAKSAAKKRKAS